MKIGLITKISKFCNMRCSYCYETPELGNNAAMSFHELERMFCGIRDFILNWGKPSEAHEIEFIWHGGEPFARPIPYWEEVLNLQQKILLDGLSEVTLVNGVQSNLTLLTDNHLNLLERFHLGFSYDVFNDYRVYESGAPTASTVVRKLDWLLSHGIRPGGIAVISKANYRHAETVATFFLKRRLSFRVLNLYQALDKLSQIAAAAITPEQYLEFCGKLYQFAPVRAALEKGWHIEPLLYASRALYSYNRGKHLKVTEDFCAEKEWKLMVNTNGDIYSPGDAYDPEFRYGNVFTDRFEEFLFESPGRNRRIERSHHRIETICKNCFLFKKSCYGTFVSHATPEEFREFESLGGCYHKLLAEMMRSQVGAYTFKDDEQTKDVLYLNITYRCNSRCLFCAADVAYRENTREMSLEDVRQALDGKRYRQIELSGGEPTIHRDFFEIVKLCSKHSRKIVLFSHGRTFRDRDFAESLLQAGINSIIIPLYGSTSLAHDYVTKVKGSFDETVQGFHNLQRLRLHNDFSCELKLLLTRYTAPLNLSVYRFARDTFSDAFDRISIRPLIYSRSAMDFENEFSAPFLEMKNDFLSLIGEITQDGKYPLRLQGFPPCFFPESLRLLGHPRLNDPFPDSRRLYADDQTSLLKMDGDTDQFTNNVVGNRLVDSCRRCIHTDYCSNTITPYFSPAYLQKFGEDEFQPILP